jgi:hypothetical protein
MPTAKKRLERRARHAADVEECQSAVRQSIKETERLIGKSETMSQRHREEHEAGDAGGASPTKNEKVTELAEQARRYRHLAQATMDLKAKCVLIEMAAECEGAALRLQRA